MAVQKGRNTSKRVNQKKEEVQTEPQVLRVGDSVIVDHGSNGDGRLVNIRETVDTIRAIYLDGSVRIGNGDVYRVAPSGNGKAKWKTVLPKKVREQM